MRHPSSGPNVIEALRTPLESGMINLDAAG